MNLVFYYSRIYHVLLLPMILLIIRWMKTMYRDSPLLTHIRKRLGGGGNFSEIGKNRFFANFSLCAKFNRFFIILGGVGGYTGKKFP